MNKFSCLHSSFLLNVTWSTHKILRSLFYRARTLFCIETDMHFPDSIFFFFKLFICTSAIHYIPSTFLQKIEDVLLRIYSQREWSLHNVGEGISILTLWNKKKGSNCVEGWTPSKKILKEAQNFASSAKLYWQARCEGRWWKESELSCRNTADCGDPAL